MFKPGQTIICVNDSFDPIQQATIPRLPGRDKKYTVRDAFQVTRNGTSSGIWAIHLNEVTNPHLPHPSGLGTFEPSFAAERFAMLQDQEAASTKAINAMLEELVKETELEMI